MAFSSVPVYLDPPNWQQQANQHQQLGGVVNENPLQLSPAMPPLPGAGGGGIGSIRPGSMTDRARLAKITTQPESALKCPRCESTNTKFCYFNNYSLSQPRHFCKTCRRYWTRGGALRNVPVGGGCRRNNNKRTKRARSKSPVKGDEIRRNGTSNDVVISNLLPPPTHNTNNLPFLSTTTTTPNLHNFSEFTCTQNGLNHQMEVQSFSSTARFTDQLRFQQMQQQFPFFAALEHQPSTNLYQYEDQAAAEYDSNIGTKALELSGNVKVEENKSVSQGNNMMMNLPRNNLGFANNHQFNWTDHITGYASTSTSQLL